MGDHCDEALTHLYLYLDGELDDTGVSRIQDHIEQCPPCGGAFSFEHKLKHVVRARLQEEVPEAFLVRLRMVIQSETPL